MAHSKLHFVIGGVMKAGTCTLDAIFRQHSQIQMASLKETHFFDNEDHDWEAPDYEELHAMFADKDERLLGEATPVTIYWRPAIQRLQAYNPEIKIILLLRDPVTRAFSHWQQEYSRRRESLPFSEAIRHGRGRFSSAPGGLHRFFSYVERGLYGDQMTNLARHFPTQNIHCEIFEEFFGDRPAALQRIADFLDIAPFSERIPDIHVNPAHIVPYPSRLVDEDIAYLSEIFHDQIAAVEAFLGRPITQWSRK